MSRRPTRRRGHALFVRYMPADVPEDQRWFWTEHWQRGEREASKQIRKHFTKDYYDDETLMRGLVGPPFKPWKIAR